MIVLLIVAVAGLFFISGPDGEPILKLKDFKPDMTLPESVSEMLDEGLEDDEGQITRVYKWQDEKGVWQFSNRPEDANGAETIELDGVINTMGSLEELERNSPSKDPEPRTESMPSLTTVPFSKAMETLDKAGEMQQTVDKRKSDIDKALGTN
jgi:hypothetical protein